MVGILVLVYQDVPEPVLVFHEYIWKTRKKFIGSQQKVIKIHGPGFETTVHVFLINIPHPGSFCHRISLYQFRVLEIGLYGDQTVLVGGDPILYLLVLIDILVQPHFLDDGGDQALGILGVIDGKIAGVAQFVSVKSEQTCKNGMKGSHPQILGLGSAHQVGDPFLHLPGGLVGEGEGENVKGIHILLH